MNPTTHTFLLEPAVWRAAGEFTGQAGDTNSVAGEATIAHERKLWRNTSRMRVQGEAAVEYTNVYEIVPFPHGSAWTCWTSHNPSLGRLIGRFVLMRDTIMSVFESEDGAYHGAESMLQVTPDCYQCRGALLRGGVLVSHWSVELTRRR
jgi:hypothetical protein